MFGKVLDYRSLASWEEKRGDALALESGLAVVEVLERARSLRENVFHGLDGRSPYEHLDDVGAEPPIIPKKGMSFWNRVNVFIEEENCHVLRVFREDLVADEACTAGLKQTANHPRYDLRVADDARAEQLSPAVKNGDGYNEAGVPEDVEEQLENAREVASLGHVLWLLLDE